MFLGDLRMIGQAAVVIVCLLGFCSASRGGGADAEADTPDQFDYTRDIRPILARHCFDCHGADKPKGQLRLDRLPGLLEPAASGMAAVVPGSVEESEILWRVRSDDLFDQMPPRGRRVSEQEIATLEAWITQGAPGTNNDSVGSSSHWAYRPVERPALPVVSQPGWENNPIDQFVLARLKAQGLSPAPIAEPAQRLRRAALALTGLPPTVAQIDAFLADPSQAGYEGIVDELLSSHRFGQRWARPWLDLARYADSNGFQSDQMRESWAYRDWVVEAINRDLPVDQFCIEQLAGDLLPNPTLDQRIATGFHRATTCNIEAGVHPEENRVSQVIDRVNTTATAFLGITLECAQCHDHKYDPFSQEEYYQFLAFLNNTPLEVELESGVSYDFAGPVMDLPLTADQRARRDRWSDQLASYDQELQRIRSSDDRRQWEVELRQNLESPPDWQIGQIESVEATGDETWDVLEDRSILASGPVPESTVTTIQIAFDVDRLTAIGLEALTHPSLPGSGPGRGDPQRTNFILSEWTARTIDPDGELGRPIGFRDPTADFSQSGWEVAKAIDGNRRTGWAIAPQFHQPHRASFRLVEPLQRPKDGGPIRLSVALDQNYGQGRVLGRIRISAWTGTPEVIDVSDEMAAALACEVESRTQSQVHLIDELYARGFPRLQSLLAERDHVQKQLESSKPSTTLVMTEMDKPRMTHVLMRGNYLSPGEPVEPGVPGSLHPFQPEWPRNRLGLARWLVAPDNPLMARVTINRWWSQLFGQGLVNTPGDLGTRSDPPSHPQLLDWLADELVNQGWSRKSLIRLMVTSSTFQQSSRMTSQRLAVDPSNRWLARGPRFRMPAEMIRDNALAIAGLLDDGLGGPPIMPYQPDGVWKSVGRNQPKWIVSEGSDRFRRGLYVVWRRSSAYPSFLTFDAPDRASCTVERPRTNTPLQALTLLNDRAYVEAALGLATRVLTDHPDSTDQRRISYAFRRTLARSPSPAERQELLQLLQDQRRALQSRPKQVKLLLKPLMGVPAPQDSQARVETAAWSIVAAVLLNLDETITRN